MEAPGLVIEDVMKLERRAMEKKVAYIEHFLTMSEDEKKVRNDLRDGKRKKKKQGEEQGQAKRQRAPQLEEGTRMRASDGTVGHVARVGRGGRRGVPACMWTPETRCACVDRTSA